MFSWCFYLVVFLYSLGMEAVCCAGEGLEGGEVAAVAVDPEVEMVREAARKLHSGFFLKFLDLMPNPYVVADTNRIMMAYFCVSAVEMLGHADKLPREAIIDWIYALQVTPKKAEEVAGSEGDEGGSYWEHCGFRGGNYLGHSFDPSGESYEPSQHDHGHIAMTYTALVTLSILGDDLSRVQRGK